jgi:hypothetical protein
MCATEKAVGGAAAKKAAGDMVVVAEDAEVVEADEEEEVMADEEEVADEARAEVDGCSGRMGSKRGAFDCEREHICTRNKSEL